jgi:hypothetical protein
MNNSRELQIAYQIKRELNLDARRLSPATAERLRAARERALAGQRQPVARLATAGGPAGFGVGFGWIGQLAPLVVLVGGLIGINYWHQTQRAAELADIDMQVLTDDLPVQAYADKGFGAWLGRTEQ